MSSGAGLLPEVGVTVSQAASGGVLVTVKLAVPLLVLRFSCVVVVVLDSATVAGVRRSAGNTVNVPLRTVVPADVSMIAAVMVWLPAASTLESYGMARSPAAVPLKSNGARPSVWYGAPVIVGSSRKNRTSVTPDGGLVKT